MDIEEIVKAVSEKEVVKEIYRYDNRHLDVIADIDDIEERRQFGEFLRELNGDWIFHQYRPDNYVRKEEATNLYRA